MKTNRSATRSGWLVAGTGIAMSSVAAFGQSTTGADQSQESTGLEEVVVSAQRFEASIQKTPIAITAVTAELLTERLVSNVLEAASEIPGILITPTQGSNTNARIALRGVGQNTGGINFDPAVGIYIDNVYQPRINGAFFEFFDIAQLEVLRGPQGTLYGRNTSGGALKINTKSPSFDWNGAFEAAAGNFNAVGAKAYLTGPISDTLAFSVSGTYRERDGYLYGVEYGRRVGNMDTRAQRAKLLFKPNDSFSAELSVFGIQDDSEAGMGVPLQVQPGVRIPQATGFNRDMRRTELFGPFGQGNFRNNGAALNATYSLSDTTSVNLISGYGKLKTFSTGNTIWVTPALQAAKDRGDNVTAQSSNEGRTTNRFDSHELNFTHTGDSLQGVVGVFYFKEEGSSRSVSGTSATIDQDRGVDSWALFAEGTYRLAGGVALTAGIRYTEEKASFTQFYRLQLARPQSASETFTSTTPKFGVSWEASDNTLLYLTYTQGFKSGGFNPVPPNTNVGVVGQIGSPTPYDPEDIESIEAGVKFQTSDRRFRVNVAAYRAEYDGLQLPVFFPFTSNIYTSNATGAVVKGVEMEPTWQVSEALQLYGNLSITTGAYTGSFDCNNQFGVRIDCKDKDIANLIPRKGMVGFRYAPELAIPGQVRFTGSANYHSDYFNNVANEGPLVGTIAATVYNASVRWTSASERWNVSLDVRNLTDKVYSLAGIQLSHPTQPSVTGYPNAPREVMLRVGTTF